MKKIHVYLIQQLKFMILLFFSLDVTFVGVHVRVWDERESIQGVFQYHLYAVSEKSKTKSTWDGEFCTFIYSKVI